MSVKIVLQYLNYGFNFTYPFSIKAGPIREWQLKGSIESEGIEIFSMAEEYMPLTFHTLSFTLPPSLITLEFNP